MVLYLIYYHFLCCQQNGTLCRGLDVSAADSSAATSTHYLLQGWVIQRRRILRRIVFIMYLTVFFKLLRIIRFWALNEFCSHKPPRAPQKHSQAL